MWFILWLLIENTCYYYDKEFDILSFILLTAIVLMMRLCAYIFKSIWEDADEDFATYYSARTTENKEIERVQDIKTVVDYIRRENAPEFNNYFDDQIVDFIPRSEVTQLARLINNGSIKFGPELERVANYMRETNSPHLNDLSDLDIVSNMNYQEIERILKQIDTNIHIPEDYILTNIKGFNNIEIYSNVKSFLIKPLKQPLNSSLCSTNKPIIIDRNTIISELHLHYLLTIIDAAVGE